MKSIRTRLIICILGIASFSSCQYQEEVIKSTVDTNNTTNYYDLLEEGLNTVFNDTYSNVTINTTFGEIANMFEKNSKDFFADKGFTVTDSDIAHTRGVYSSPFDNMNNLNENQKAVVERVTTILQLPVYEDVLSEISDLYEQISNLPAQKGKEEILRYIKYINNMLTFLEKYSGRGCVWPDGGSNKNEGNWWQRWGKCAAAILGGAGLEGLGGAGIGSVVPGLGTVTGAIIGSISGAFNGAIVGC